MAKSTGIVLTATGISLGNEWAHTGRPNFRIGIAGLMVALIFDGVEKINEKAAVGLATMMLITVLVTPMGGDSPAQTVAKWTSTKPKQPLAANAKTPIQAANPSGTHPRII